MAKSKHNRKGKTRGHFRSRPAAGRSQGLDQSYRHLKLFNIEVHGEPVGKLNPKVEPLLAKSVEYIHRGNGAEGERLLRLAIEIDPDNPTLLNNLAKALGMQAKRSAAEALTYEIHRRFPDYLFGRANLALILIEKGEYDQAKELLKPLLEHKRLHFAEFSTVAAAHVKLAMAEGRRDDADHWFDMMKRVDPEDPNLLLLQAQMNLGPGELI